MSPDSVSGSAKSPYPHQKGAKHGKIKDLDAKVRSKRDLISSHSKSLEIKSKEKEKGKSSEEDLTDDLLNYMLQSYFSDNQDEGFPSSVLQNPTIPFNQHSLFIRLHPNLNKIELKYKGLCEIICNKILMDDLLDKGEERDFLKDEITADSLDQDRITKSHILKVYPLFKKMLTFLCGVYPDNFFSNKEHKKLLNKNKNINRTLLFKKLESLETGAILKFAIFKKTKKSFSGHSMLIKKTEDNKFIFFDPDHGEFRGLTQEDLAEKIDWLVKASKSSNLLFTRGDIFLKRLKERKITSD